MTERKLAPLEAAITDRGLWGRIGSAWKPPVVTPKRDEATEDPLNPPGPRAPVLPAILFVLRSNNGPAVGWDVNSGRFVQVGEPGHLDVVPKAATADGASSPADGAPTGTAAPASSAA